MKLCIINPAPTIVSISPSSAATGSPAFTLVVNGANFVPGATVQWNGANRLTTYVSSTQLTALISANDVTAAAVAAAGLLVHRRPGARVAPEVFVALVEEHREPRERAELRPVVLLADLEPPVPAEREEDDEEQEEVPGQQVEPAEVRDDPVEERLGHRAEVLRCDHTPENERERERRRDPEHDPHVRTTPPYLLQVRTSQESYRVPPRGKGRPHTSKALVSDHTYPQTTTRKARAKPETVQPNKDRHA